MIMIGLMTNWDPFTDNEDECDNYFHVPARPVREILDPIINDYRRLHYLAAPGYVDFFCFVDLPAPPEHLGESWKQAWLADVAVKRAVGKLKDIQLEYGWNPTTKTQESFRKDGYLERRQQYWDTTVVPLEEQRDDASTVARGR